MPNEVELKFDLDPGDEEAVRRAQPLQAAVSESHDYETLYFDTQKRALNRAGYSLRVRRIGDRFVQTIKHKNGGSAGLFVRGEWEADVAGFEPAPEASKSSGLNRILARTGRDALRPLVRTSFTRTRWQVDWHGSRIEVVLDEGRVSCGGVEAPIREVELELIEGKPNALFRLAREIGATTSLRLGVLSKGERGYALADGLLGAAAKADPVRLRETMDEGEAFRTIAYACIRHFRLNEIALLSGRRDAEALHQARVALRRLRSAMNLFRRTLEGDEGDRLKDDLRWLTRQLGKARNLDVLVARYGAKKPAPAELLLRREQAYDEVAGTLRAPRRRSLFLRLAMWVDGGAWRSRDRASRPIGTLAERQLSRQWEKVARKGARIPELDEEALHKLRIAVKKLRYSTEFLSGLYAGKAVRADRNHFLAALKRLQERLGELNDLRLGQELEPTLANVGGHRRARSPARLVKAAELAFRQATEAAGYWVAR